MIGGISTAGILGAKAIVKYKGVKKESNINVGGHWMNNKRILCIKLS
jgi:hypothetical protein